MYNYKTTPHLPFNIMDCYNQIAGASFRFEAEGHLNIWIYLKHKELQFHYVELKPMQLYFVAHYPCHKVTHGFSNSEWQRLGALLAAVYLSQI